MIVTEEITGGANLLALISGEKFTVNVVKVVNGNIVDSVTLTQKCLQSTGHAGYNHSTNLRTLANTSNFSGYKGYNWGKYTTVPSSYKEGLAPNNNYASVHYNITGSAPYKADETLFLFFEDSKTYTYTLNYNANDGSGAPATQTATSTATSYSFIVSDKTPTRTDYTFLGWADSASGSVKYKAGSPIMLQSSSPNKTIYAVWEKNEPVQPNRNFTLTKVFKGLEEIPANFSLNYKVVSGNNTAERTFNYGDATVDTDKMTLTWNAPYFYGMGTDNSITIVENADVSGYTYVAEVNVGEAKEHYYI